MPQEGLRSRDFSVDFHERGQNPPRVLHSEGQDSMGLCLYRAPAERLSHGVIGLVPLNDVVMSVDAGTGGSSRRALKEALPDRQLLITSRDKVWANQLRAEGVVTSKQLLEFGAWDIESGPYVAQSDTSEEIDAATDRAAVRRGGFAIATRAGKVLGGAAARLGAKVTHRASGQYALEEVLGPACDRLKALLTKGKAAASSWDNRDEATRLAAVDARLLGGAVQPLRGQREGSVRAQSRGICPSCMGRRIIGTVALLVEHRFPEVPWREWVPSFEDRCSGECVTGLTSAWCRRFGRGPSVRMGCGQQ